ncbi:conserved Plasmodium protein, unknown function [Plasmodium ovale wallikeri]|uniref:Uncharacterized protein n=2 Tax=Plasmodium ovale TaxID=36330 RepID=A0A1A8ZAH9_PLAOA|nr:conserved Plasmodium protein, unknown function [Plasmodium ovale wallikeri]SBT40836.1 conserved Plasmodium protein, unknown function [Plasmodium ovale wallikeri]SBT78029.1 conserved Plasmodium protein, unknown function [Plasmodium ovale]
MSLHHNLRLDKNFIFFTEPYHQIAGVENYKNDALNKVIAQNIYDNLKNNIDYIKETQYNYQGETSEVQLGNIKLDSNNFNRNNSNSSWGHKEKGESECLKNKAVLNNSDIAECICTERDLHYKTHNILKHDRNNVEIHHCIPSIHSEEFSIIDNIKKNNSDVRKKGDSRNEHSTMNDPRYNNYPPMNEFGYNHHNVNNGNGFCTNTYNRELANLTMQQHNMHGRNNLMFEEGNIPHGLYDQSNYTGTNSLMCGNVALNEPKMMYRTYERNDPSYNYSPMTNGMGYNTPGVMTPLQYNPNMGRNAIKGGYAHECHYRNNARNNTVSKPSFDIANDKNHKKDTCRKNVSKVKKGDIDINIETSSSNRRGVVIDLNIGVGN